MNTPATHPAKLPISIDSDGSVITANATKEDLDWLDTQNGGEHYICIEFEGTIVDEDGNFIPTMDDRIRNLLRSKRNVVVAVYRKKDIKKVEAMLMEHFGQKMNVVRGFDENMVEFWSGRAVKFKNGLVA